MPPKSLKYLLGLALLASTAAANQSLSCFNYSPFYHEDYFNGRVAELLDRDFATARRRGITCIKTFHTAFFGNPVTDVAAKHGLKVVLGVFMQDPSLLGGEVDNAIKACQQRPDSLIGIVVGNENLNGGNQGEFFAIIDKIKGSGCRVPVGTAQKSPTYLDGTFSKEFAEKVDFMGVSLYSFFGPIPNQERPIEPIRGQLDRLRGLWEGQGHKFRATEIGWPTGGSFAGNVGSLETGQRFIDQIAGPVCEGYFGDWIAFFQMFDEPNKQGGEFERHFGLLQPDGSNKLNIDVLIQCSKDANAVAAPAGPEAPAPGPPAPTPGPPAPPQEPAPTPAPPAPTPAPPSTTPMYPLATDAPKDSTEPVAVQLPGATFTPSPADGSAEGNEGPVGPVNDDADNQLGGAQDDSDYEDEGEDDGSSSLSVIGNDGLSGPDNNVPCPIGQLPVSVEGIGTFCTAIPICVGGIPDGNCPPQQAGLPNGARCAIVKTGVAGCVSN